MPRNKGGTTSADDDDSASRSSDDWRPAGGETGGAAGAARTRRTQPSRRARPANLAEDDDHDDDSDHRRRSQARMQRKRKADKMSSRAPRRAANSSDSSFSSGDESSETSHSVATDDSASSISSPRSGHRHKRRHINITPSRCKELAAQSGALIFKRVKGRVKNIRTDYRPSLWERISEHFLIKCFSNKSFNCVSLAIRGNILHFTANSWMGYDECAYRAYQAARRADGWQVKLRVSSDETQCFHHNYPTRPGEKTLHAEIEQFHNLKDFDDMQFGPNKLCCFYCASILLAWQEAGNAPQWNIYSHGKVYDYSLPHILFSPGLLGRTYFGADVHQKLCDADNRSRDLFEQELHQIIAKKVKRSDFGRIQRTRVGAPCPPPTYSAYQARHGLSSSRTMQRGGGATSSTSRRRSNNQARHSE